MEKDIKIKRITDVEWFESKINAFGNPYYCNRFSQADIEGVPGIALPRIIARKNFDTNDIEYINVNR